LHHYFYLLVAKRRHRQDLAIVLVRS